MDRRWRCGNPELAANGSMDRWCNEGYSSVALGYSWRWTLLGVISRTQYDRLTALNAIPIERRVGVREK